MNIIRIMKEYKSMLIASAVICFLMLMIFLTFQLILSQSVIMISSEPKIELTPMIEKEGTDSDQEKEYLATQTPNLPGVYSTGMVVQIANTGGDGLRIRSGPSTIDAPLYLGQEGEIFTIVDGPEIVESTIWWKIQSQSDENKLGWAVQEYLAGK